MRNRSLHTLVYDVVIWFQWPQCVLLTTSRSNDVTTYLVAVQTSDGNGVCLPPPPTKRCPMRAIRKESKGHMTDSCSPNAVEDTSRDFKRVHQRLCALQMHMHWAYFIFHIATCSASFQSRALYNELLILCQPIQRTFGRTKRKLQNIPDTSPFTWPSSRGRFVTYNNFGYRHIEQFVAIVSGLIIS